MPRRAGSTTALGTALGIAAGATLAGIEVRPAHADDPRDLFGLGKGKGKGTASDGPGCDAPDVFGCALELEPLGDDSPYGLTTWLPAAYLERLPVANGTYDTVAHWAMGASRDDVGPTFGGATGLENRWMIDGAPVDSMRSGNIDVQLPIAFIAGVTVSAGGFRARDRVGTGGAIDATLVRGGPEHTVDARIYAGLSSQPTPRPIAARTYQIRRLRVEPGPELTASVVATGPLATIANGRAWYAAGIAPTLTHGEFQWTASRLVDLNNDGAPDGLPYPTLEPITFATRDDRDYAVPFLARAGWDRGAHSFDATLVGHAAEVTRYNASATLPAAGIDRTDLVASGALTWRGTWKNTRAHVQMAWHRSDRSDAAHDAAAAGIPQRLTAYIPATLPDDPQLAERCALQPLPDGTDPLLGPPCPVLTGYFASGGAGTLVEAVGDRPTTTAEVAHRIDNHVVRAGGTFEDTRLVLTSRYTGERLIRSLFDGHEDIARFFSSTCAEEALGECTYADESRLRYRTRHTALFVEDTWLPQDNIVVDGGVRWETMRVGSQLHHKRQLAPRGGFAWDFLGAGRSRAWVSGGRSFAYLPAGVGATIIARDRIVHDITALSATGRTIEDGGVYLVEEDIAPMTQDELTAGIEVGAPHVARATLWAQGRYLRSGLETSPTGFGNPGATNSNLGIGSAERQSELIGAEVAAFPFERTAVRVGYLRGRTIGNFAGPYDPQTGAQLYDGLQLNSGFQSSADTGRLPTDPGQRFYLEADRRGRLGPIDLHVGTRLTVASGRPRSVYADTDVGFISLIPRGTAGRGPLVTQANLRAGARWRGIDVTLDVFNLFDRSAATGFDDYYADGTLRPIEGGSYEDLIFLKTTGLETNAGRSTRYGLPYAFQSPISAFLAIRAAL